MVENSIHSSSGLRSSALCCQRRPLVAHMCSTAERVATFGHGSASTVIRPWAEALVTVQNMGANDWVVTFGHAPASIVQGWGDPLH